MLSVQNAGSVQRLDFLATAHSGISVSPILTVACRRRRTEGRQDERRPVLLAR
jgi:hypothetical protein